jgi:DNA modification methylase
MSDVKVEVKTLDDLQPDPNNVNKHTVRGHQLVENSLRKRGAFRSIAAAGKGVDKPVVMAGNLTIEKARDAGFDEVIFVHTNGRQLVSVIRDDIAPGSAEAIALGLEDNESAKQSYNADIDVLAALAAGDNAILSALRAEDKIFDGMLEGMGLKEETKDAEPQVDRAAELLEKWQVKTGDLWQIGEHRLICGDCTDAATVARVMDGVEKYSVLTDPPYNIGFTYEKIDDEMSKADYREFCRKFFDNIVPNSIGAIITPGPRNERLYPEPRDKGIWVKPNATAGASCFHLRLAEPIMFYGKFAEKRNTDVFEYSSGFSKELTAAQRAAGVADKHAPAKSVPLWEELIKMLVPDVVLDVFGGNGTTMLACENLDRKCRMVEMSEAYCAVILERMATAFPDLEIRKIL